MSDTLLSLDKARLAFGDRPLLDNADLLLRSGERIGLIGRNGAGKSSLLHVLAGETSLDDGEIRRRSGVRIAAVAQEPALPDDEDVLSFLSGNLLATEDWQRPARAGALIDALGLSPQAPIGQLSGGARKRVALAHALVQQPDLLLLDEPTNHLDFEGIAWLEQQLLQSRLSLVFVTHDRHFLDTIATRIVELDRGQLLSFPGNFSAWEQHKAAWLDAQAKAEARFDKFLSQEEVWIRKGVQARRTRNEGRVRRLEALRRERAARREQAGQVRFSLAGGERSGRLVAELRQVTQRFGDRTLIDHFSTLVQRGDRIGLIGPNGAGKTTLLKILLGELKPTAGQVRLGTRLSIGYFDQMRAGLDEDATLVDTISPGSDWVEIAGQRRHVMSYLEDFLFSPARARSPVATLSGGERARLVLARLFAQPHNVLVLDEPTNDLDIDTLELLENLLQDYPGTVLLVSHDRRFLDNVVTQTIAAEGNGQWMNYVGGYADWAAQRRGSATAGTSSSDRAPDATDTHPPEPTGKQPDAPNRKLADTRKSPANATSPSQKARLAPWEADELAQLPDQIDALEAKQAQLAEQLADPDLYRDGPEQAAEIRAQLKAMDDTLQTLFNRWAQLEEKETR